MNGIYTKLIKEISVKTNTTTFRDTYEQIRNIILKWISKSVWGRVMHSQGSVYGAAAGSLKYGTLQVL